MFPSKLFFLRGTTHNQGFKRKDMKISLKQYLFLLDQHVVYGLLNDLSTFKSKRDLWSEISRQRERVENYVEEFDCNHSVKKQGGNH